MKKARKLSRLLTGLMLAVLAGLLFVMERNASSYALRITRLCAINIVLALSMNLINGFTGLFSLGQAGFMAIGAYVTALCTSPAAKGAMMFMIAPQPKALASLNLPFGGALVIGGALAAGAAFLRKDKKRTAQDVDYVYPLFPRLKERAWQPAGALSVGEQQMLAVGRALMSRPQALMMDEPSLGLAPLVVKDIFRIIRRMNADGITVPLIEQNAHGALKAAHYGYVLETEEITLAEPGGELLANESVREAYLGKASS